MKPSDWASGLAVAIIAVVLLASGPIAGGLVAPAGTPTTVGGGTGSVASVDVETEDLHFSPGRFGTDATYLRLPDATVDVSAFTGRPRLVYRIELPALSADATATRMLTETGTHRLHVRDQGFEPARITNESYRATVSVSVQSFDGDRTFYRQNVTAEVRR